jgi:hypothetical protein
MDGRRVLKGTVPKCHGGSPASMASCCYNLQQHALYFLTQKCEGPMSANGQIRVASGGRRERRRRSRDGAAARLSGRRDQPVLTVTASADGYGQCGRLRPVRSVTASADGYGQCGRLRPVRTVTASADGYGQCGRLRPVRTVTASADGYG